MNIPDVVHLVVPGDADDPALPSGGNAYDRRVARGLAAAGWAVPEIAVDGSWPRPAPADRAALDRVLAGLPDGAVVLLDGLVACGVPAVVVPHATRLRIVVLVHLALAEEAPDLAAAEHEVLTAVSAVVATSPWTARRLGVDGVHIATPGVDPAPAARGTNGAGRLLCVGSITPTKGQDLLVDALAAVTDLPWTCDLVGPLRRDPAHVELVRRSIGNHGLGDRVRITGPLAGAALDAVFDAADLLVLPSRVEAYGMVLTEALARGTPVLATAVGGVPETVGDAGLVVAPSGLAGALRGWLADPDLRDELRAAARRARLDGWEVTTRCLANALNSTSQMSLPGTRV